MITFFILAVTVLSVSLSFAGVCSILWRGRTQIDHLIREGIDPTPCPYVGQTPTLKLNVVKRIDNGVDSNSRTWVMSMT